MKTTKGGKFMNPTDAYRKELRKRELKRNKKERKKVREVGILKKDPEAIKEQIRKLEMMKADGALDKTRRHKKRQLEDTLNLVLKKRKEYEEKMREKGEEPVMFSHLPAPRRRATPAEEEERVKHMKPEDSVYYHPTLNPSGAPPPGKPPMYKSSIGPRIPLTGESSGSKLEGGLQASTEVEVHPPPLPAVEEVGAAGEPVVSLPVPMPPPPPAPPRPVSTTVTTPLPPPPIGGVSQVTSITRDLPPPPPPPRIPLSGAPGVTAEKSIKPPGTDEETLVMKRVDTGGHTEANSSEELVSSTMLPPPPPRRQVSPKVSEDGEDVKIEKTTPSADATQQKAPPPPPMRLPPAMMRPPPGPPPGPPQQSSSSEIPPSGMSRLPPPPPPGIRPPLPLPSPQARMPLAGMAPPPRPPPSLPPASLSRPPGPVPPGPPPLMRPPPGPPPMMGLYRGLQSGLAPPPPPPRRLDGVDEPSKSLAQSKPSYIKTAAATVIKRPLAQHTPELTSMVPASVRVRRENAQKSRPKTSANATILSTVTLAKPLSASSAAKPQSIDDSYSAFLEDMKALGAFEDGGEAIK